MRYTLPSRHVQGHALGCVVPSGDRCLRPYRSVLPFFPFTVMKTTYQETGIRVGSSVQNDHVLIYVSVVSKSGSQIGFALPPQKAQEVINRISAELNKVR